MTKFFSWTECIRSIIQFCEGGFEKIVGQVERIEKSLGIYEPSQFTPFQYRNL